MKIWSLETKINDYIEYYDINELDDNYIKMIYNIYNNLTLKYILKSSIIKSIEVESITKSQYDISFILNNNDKYLFKIIDFDKNIL